MARARKSKSSAVKVNFKGVESRKTPHEGDYRMEVIEAKSEKSGNGNDQIAFVCEVSAGEFKGVKGYLYCPLAENSLWKLHAFLTALGEEVPEDEMEIELSELIGKEFMGVMSHEVYNGKKRAKLTDFDSIENYEGDDADEDDDEDEKPSKKKSSKKPKTKKKSDDEDEDDEDEKKSSKKKPSSKKSSKDDDDDEEDEEDEKPKKGKASKGKSKKKTYSADDVRDMDEDELEELLEEAGLDDEVDLDDYKNLKKKVAAVLEALEEADLLEDDD